MSLADETVAVIGATGAVGREMLGLLAQADADGERVRAYARARSAGSRLPFGDGEVTVRALGELDADAETPGVALLAASSDVSKRWGPALVERGAVVIDNSSAFRMAADVPLVIPEVNGGCVAGDATPRLIANPNCSTIIMLVAAEPIRTRFGVSSMTVSTYQAASGAGLAAMEELREQTAAALSGGSAEPRVFAEPCAFNVFSHDSPVDVESGLNVEESKMIAETRKLWADGRVVVRPTCVRVPVLRAHAESISIATERPATLDGVLSALHEAESVEVVDDRAGNVFPTSLRASHRHDVLVGRVRVHACGVHGGSTVELFAAGDQLLKGAALNAVQIARLIFG